MNLIVDIGNSVIKLAVAVQGKVIDMVRAESWSDDATLSFFRHYEKFDRGIVASVRSEKVPSWLNDMVTHGILFFDHSTPVPIVNGYETPYSLGLDRLAAAVGANNIYPKSNVLVVDCGTAITIDLVSAEGVFVGGNISLGLRTRFKALSTFTSKLPLVDISDEIPLLGKNTVDAIRAGVLNGAIFELNSYLEVLTPQYPELKVLFTGGDAFFFDGKLKNPIFVVPNLVVLGLNRILEHNV